MEDVVSVAALPVDAMRPPAQAADGVQLVEGYAGDAQGMARAGVFPIIAAARCRGGRGSRTTAR
jgi:hypothetical protein